MTEELNDYSGDLKPNLRMQDFSKDFLARFHYADSMMYNVLMALWFGVVKKKCGNEVAQELNIELAKALAPVDVRLTCEEADIQGHDVISFFKYVQISPSLGPLFNMDFIFEIKNKNHGIITMKNCKALVRLEKQGDSQLQKHVCGIVEESYLGEASRQFHPNMKMTCLKRPPRKDSKEIACKWEFKIEE